MVELDSIRYILSLNELPQLFPYFGHFYNAVENIHHCCYHHSNTADMFTERAHLRFMEVIKCIENEQDREKALKDYNDWRETPQAKSYWNERTQVVIDNTESSSTQQSETTDNTTTTEVYVETIRLVDVKGMIIENITVIDENREDLDAFSKFKRSVYDSLGRIPSRIRKPFTTFSGVF